MEKQAVIILGHGSKSNDAIEDFDFIVQATREALNNEGVYGAHMELAEPSLENLVKKISNNRDVNKLAIVPYFLFNGNHIKKDIPAKIEKLKEQFPHIQFKLASPIGKELLMVDLLKKKVGELS